MGRKYSSASYKKSYEGDYMKVYNKNHTLERKQGKEYGTEKYVVKAEGLERVNRSVQRQNNKILPPPLPVENEDNQTVIEDDLSSINSSAVRPPIVYLKKGLYRNIYTKKDLTEDEVRSLLMRNGYIPQTKSIIGYIILLSIIISIGFPYIGLAILLLASIARLIKGSTTYVKKMNSIKLKFTLPATPEEREIYKQQAKLCFIITICFVVVFYFI